MSSLAEVVSVIKEENRKEAARKDAAEKLAISNENKKFKDLNVTRLAVDEVKPKP